MGNTATNHKIKNAESEQEISTKILLSDLKSIDTVVDNPKNEKLVLIDENTVQKENLGKSNFRKFSYCVTNKSPAEKSAASELAQQKRNQKINSSKISFHSISFGKNKIKNKSLNSLQLKQYSNTPWPRPIRSSTFSSHFKEVNNQNNLFIKYLIAKGAYGVVYKVQYMTHRSKHQKSNKFKEPIKLEYQTQDAELRKNKFPSSSCSGNDNVYALKVLKKSKIIDENNVQQIKTEVDILKLCGHHNFIVQLIDTWQSRLNLYILTEFVANGELFEKIHTFSIDLARLYVAEIALAIDFLHNAGIIYRDAKPENILLGKDYHIKLIDFGLSKRLKRGRQTNTICGTLEYMAPEIFLGKSYGHAVDWWALGVILCKMLTQRGPDMQKYVLQFQKLSMEDKSYELTGMDGLSLKIADFLPDEINCLSSEAQDIIERLLVIDPQNRLRSVLAMQRIAMFKNFQINEKYLMNLRPYDFITKGEFLNEKEHFENF